jgi:hypothetical protein
VEPPLKHPKSHLSNIPRLHRVFRVVLPNAHKLTNASVPGVPENRMTGEEFVVLEDGFENVRVRKLGKRCGFWRGIARDVPV